MVSAQELPSIVADTEALQVVRKILDIDGLAFRPFAVEPPRTLLLSGPPGVGKTKSVRIAAREKFIPVFTVAPGPHACDALRKAFKSASITAFNPINQKPASACIVFIDEIDVVCPANTSESLESTMNTATSLLLSFMDPPLKVPNGTIREVRPMVFVIAATNRPNAMHASLRRAGRFDREAVLSPPSVAARCDLLCALEPNIDRKVLLGVAKRTVGFVAADLAALCKSARSLDESDMGIAKGNREGTQVPHDLFRRALQLTTPSVLRRAIAAKVPVASWDDIGGVEDVKKRLKMAVEWPLLHADTFQRLGLKAPRGILLHGPPGCSKTSLVRAVASQSHASFIRLNGADIYSCYLGEAERILRESFAMARAAAPCVLFLDEIDAIVGKRSLGGSQTDGNDVQERVLSTLLTEMDGVVSATGVLVIGATNRIDMLDDALLRPGRFDDVLEVVMPDEAARLQILCIHTAKLPLGEDVNLCKIAEQTEGKSGADLMSVCVGAGLAALREEYVPRESTDGDATYDDTKIIVRSRHFNMAQDS